MNLTKDKQRGFSLPELMVAILLGTIVTTAVIGMYLSTSRNFSQDERYALMQENGRYALRTLAEDLAMADFWGKLTAADSIRNTVGLSTSGNCAAGTPGAGDGVDLLGDQTAATTAILYNNNHTGGTSHFTPCTEITDVQRPGTDLLVIKRAKGMPETGLSDGVVRVRVSGTAGSLVNTGAPAADETDWIYMPRIYFIRTYFDTPGDGIPSLCRMDLVNVGLDVGMGKLLDPTNASGVVDDVNCIAEGIEDLHVQFGIDTDLDGIANQYLSSPTLAQMDGVVSARVYLLARSSDPDPYFTDVKSFNLGDATLNQGNLTGTSFYRRVFTTTVMLRNPVNLNLLNN